jgi:RNA polymerase sigma-70 factor (ECF subfamily)
MATSKRRDAENAAGSTGLDLDAAFAELRPAMFGLAYRITGSRADAEDIVQDAFLRLHDAEPGDAIRSLKAYLATITARLSLNRVRNLQARRETYVGEWLPEPLLTGGEPAVRAEDVSFALLVVLERLSPEERVVFVLRTAFDLAFDDIAPVVGRDAAVCRKLFSRARERVAVERPRFTVDRARHRELVRRFLEAARGQDMDGMVALLDDKVVLHGDGGGKAFATKRPVMGNVAVARFIIAATRTLPPGATVEETEINGEPALIAKAGTRVVVAIMVDTDGERIRRVFGVANPDKLQALAT